MGERRERYSYCKIYDCRANCGGLFKIEPPPSVFRPKDGVPRESRDATGEYWMFAVRGLKLKADSCKEWMCKMFLKAAVFCRSPTSANRASPHAWSMVAVAGIRHMREKDEYRFAMVTNVTSIISFYFIFADCASVVLQVMSFKQNCGMRIEYIMKMRGRGEIHKIEWHFYIYFLFNNLKMTS